MNNFIDSNFNYCPLVWQFCSYQSSKKIKRIQKRCLMFVLNYYESDYATLSKKKNTTIMEIKRLHTLAKEIFKTITNINPSFLKNIFTLKRDPKISPYDILVKHHKTAKHDEKSLIALSPQNGINFLPM